MNDDGIALPDKSDQPIQLGPVGILTRCLICEYPIHRNLLKLAIGILIEAANSDITNAVTVQNAFPSQSVRMNSMTLGNVRQ